MRREAAAWVLENIRDFTERRAKRAQLLEQAQGHNAQQETYHPPDGYRRRRSRLQPLNACTGMDTPWYGLTISWMSNLDTGI